MPWMKLVVPSKGSMTHRKSLAAAESPLSSARMRWPGKLLEEDLGDGRFGLAVDAGDEVVFALDLDVDGGEVAEAAADHLSRFFCRPDGGAQIPVHAWFSSWRSI